jgi:hypothetical protein
LTRPAIPDVISIVGSAYLQPIADLLEKLLEQPISGNGPAGSSMHENGYSSALVILLVAVIESFTARLRFVRRSEDISGNMNTPDLLEKYFPELPTMNELIEVFLIRNALSHNHVWHFDVSDFNKVGALKLATPQELGFQTNKNYEQVVNFEARTTHILGLNISPTSVNRNDVQKVFDVIWRTLKFMNAQSFGDTPLAGSIVRFRGERWEFEDLLCEIMAVVK